MSQLAMSPPKASQGRSNTGFFDMVKKKKKNQSKTSNPLPLLGKIKVFHIHTALKSQNRNQANSIHVYLNDQLILQDHLRLFQECHHLCLRLQKYQLMGHQQYLNIVSI